jgi:hypothetical protein
MTSGRQRQEQRALHQRMPAWQERKGYRELIAKCKKFGYTVTPSRVDNLWGWRFEARIVVINGWRVHTVYMKTRGRYLAFSRSDVPADFYVGISPIGFFIFHQRYGRHFRSERRSPRSLARLVNCGFNHSHRYHYLKYLEAWKLLGRR